MDGRLVDFAQGIYLLIGILLVAGLLALLIFVAWTSTNLILFRRRMRRGQQAHYAATHDKSGRRLPPVASGICQHCGRGSRDVYFLPGGARLCQTCYAATT